MPIPIRRYTLDPCLLRLGLILGREVPLLSLLNPELALETTDVLDPTKLVFDLETHQDVLHHPQT